MGDFMVTAPDGRSFKITAPEGATREQALEYAKAHAPKEPDAPMRWADVPGAIADTFGAGRPGARTSADVLLHPKDGLETAAQMAVAAPITMGGGLLAGAAAKSAPAVVGALAPAAGRVATQGALSRAEGRDWPGTFFDMAASVLGEGGAAAVGKVASKVAAPAVREGARAAEASRVGKAGGAIFPELEAEADKDLWGAAQQWGKKQVERVFKPAINEIEAKLGGARALTIPSLSDKPVSMSKAVDAMFAAEKDARRALRGEIESALAKVNPQLAQDFVAAMEARGASYAYLGALKKGLDPSGKLDPAKLAKYVNANYDKLQNFAGRYWPKIEEALLGAGKSAPVEIAAKPEPTKILGHTLQAPMWAAQGAQKVGEAASSPAVRAMLDAALGTPPFGAVALSAAANMARPALRRIPGGKHLDDLIADEADDASGH